MKRPQKADFIYDQTGYYCDRYEGTAAALVGAGVVELNQLPGQPGQPKTQATHYPPGSPKNGGGSHISDHPGAKRIRRAGVDRFRVTVVVPTAEQERRRNAGTERARMQALQAQAQAALAQMATTPTQYRERCLTTLDVALRVARNQFTSNDMGALCIDAESLAAFDQAAAALRWRVEHMRIVSSHAVRARRAADLCNELGVSPQDIGGQSTPPRRLRLV